MAKRTKTKKKATSKKKAPSKAAKAATAPSKAIPPLPAEITQLILQYFVDDRSEEVSLWQCISPIFTTSKTFKHLLLPMLYRNVILKGEEAYLSFLTNPDIESYQYIKTIEMRKVKLATAKQMENERVAFKKLIERVEGEQEQEMEGENGEEEKEGQEDQQVVNKLWPAGVSFKIEPYKLQIAPSYGRRFSCMPRLVGLFSASSVEFGVETEACKPSSYWTAGRPPHWRLPVLRMGTTYASHYILESTLSQPETLFQVQRFVSPVWFNSIKGAVDIIEITVENDAEMILSEPAPFGRMRDRRLSMKEANERRTKAIMSACEDAITAVKVEMISRPHAFCCDDLDDIGKLRNPKLRLKCCEQVCKVEKTEHEIMISRLLRTTDPIEDHPAMNGHGHWSD